MTAAPSRDAEEPPGKAATRRRASGRRGDWGIDTVKVSVPVDYGACFIEDGHAIRTTSQRRDVEADTHRMTRMVGRSKVGMQLDSAWSSATFEFNAAGVLGLDPPMLLAPDELWKVVRYVTEQFPEVVPVFQQVRPTGEFEWAHTWAQEVKVRRLDVARNFTIDPADVPLVKEHLPRIAQRGRSGGSLATHQSRGNGWTLTRSTKTSGRQIFYDKHAQDPTVDAGVMRFETQMSASVCKDRGLARLSDVSDARAEFALRHHWQARRLGDPWPLPEKRAEQFAHVAKAERLILNSYLHDAVAGDLSLYGVREAKRLKAQARRYGFKPGQPLLAFSPLQARLDLDTGTLIRERATLPVARS